MVWTKTRAYHETCSLARLVVRTTGRSKVFSSAESDYTGFLSDGRVCEFKLEFGFPVVFVFPDKETWDAYYQETPYNIRNEVSIIA